MEGVAMVTKIFHPSSTAGTTLLLPFSTYASFLMPTMWNLSWREKIIPGRDCVLLRVDGQTSL